MYQVDGKILQAVLDYLIQMPFKEVNQLIAALQQSKRIEEAKGEQE